MIGGAERYVQSLAGELVRRGHDVVVVTSDAESQKDFWRPQETSMVSFSSFEDGIQVIRCPSTGVLGGRSMLLAWRKIMTLLSLLPRDVSPLVMRMARLVPSMPTLEATLSRLPHCNIVHAFNISWECPLVAAWQFVQDRELPLVVSPFAHFGTKRDDRIVYNNTMDHQLRILQHADAVLALTPTERRELADCDIEPKRIRVVGGGVKIELSEKGLRWKEILERYNLATPFVLFIGRLSRDKGAMKAAEAILSLHRQGRDVHLVLVGQMTSAFERYHRTLPSVEREMIQSLGLVDERTKHALLEASSILVLPSCVESFGIVLLEAWAHGKPVVAARAGGIPDVVDGGKDGFLVPCGDPQGLARAVSRLLDDELLAQRMGRKGRRKLSMHYSWRDVGDRVVDVYEDVLERTRVPGEDYS
jgi:glycosyltransferase involved in cell wall biosynthesis